MKLLFPNGEHGPAELREGSQRVGSAASADIVLVAPGIAPAHCEIQLAAGQATLRADAANLVVVNGKQAVGDVAIKPGDLVLFAKVGARVVGVERAPAPAPVVAKKPTEEVEDGRTRIRMALPKYVLRGVSGSTFGKTYPLYGTMTVGRHSDCDISVPGEEISRHHAKLQVMPDGIAVEDLGSANGTFINGKRVHNGMLKPGEELRLDTVRFLLVAPGMEAAGQGKATAKAPVTPAAAEPARGGGSWIWVGVGIALAGAVLAGLWFGGFLG